MDANEARKLTAQNIERQEEIKKQIKKGEASIRSAIELGYRREAHVHPGYCDNCGNPSLPEVIEHFKKLGYQVNWCHGTSVYEIRW